jgi:uncharacterized protein (TIGR02679 family)
VVGRRPHLLEDPALWELWDAVRARLERTGPLAHGRLVLPELTSRGRLLLGSLLGGAPGRTLDLQVLEDRLRELEVGPDLAAALTDLGHPVSDEPARRRAARRAAAAVRSTARDMVRAWDEAWTEPWIEGAIRSGLLSGLEVERVTALLADVRVVLHRIRENADARDPLSRTDLAAKVLGSAHALDWGRRCEALVTRALLVDHPGARPQEAWEAAGVLPDLVSAPALTWGLIPPPGSPLSGLCAEALRLGVPIHLSQMALRAHPLVVPAGTPILVAENPRVVEAAAQAGTLHPVVALNGDPSGAARLLVDQLLASGARMRYHGDFDAAGLRICARMHRLGLEPWRMSADDYRQAVASAEAEGTGLPADDHRSPPTPWDPELQAAFDECRLVVHEERLLPDLLS